MAEYILRQRLGEHSGWQVRSAGVFAGVGAPASREAMTALQELGIDLSPHRSQGLSRELVDESTLIVVMTAGHFLEVIRAFPQAQEKVFLMTGFGDGPTAEDIPDPIGQSLDVYRWTRDRIDSAASDLVLFIKDQWGLPDAPSSTKDTTMKIAIGADHGGYELKEHVMQRLAERKITVVDVGTHGTEAVDYPDFAGGGRPARSPTAPWTRAS